MIFNIGNGQSSPWFLRTFELSSEDMKKINGGTSFPKVITMEEMLRIDQEQEAKARELGIEDRRATMWVLTPSEVEEHEKQQRLYSKKFNLTGANTEFWDGMTEEQQWAFIDAFESISSSITSLYSSPLGWDENVVAAVYGQNLAKIARADSILKGHHTDKLMEALNYHQAYLEKEMNKPWLAHIDRNSDNFKRIADLFARTGDTVNVDEFKNQYNQAINVLSNEVGDKFSSSAMFGGIYYGYLGFILNENWNEFIFSLVSHGVGQNFSEYSHKGKRTGVTIRVHNCVQTSTDLPEAMPTHRFRGGGLWLFFSFSKTTSLSNNPNIVKFENCG